MTVSTIRRLLGDGRDRLVIDAHGRPLELSLSDDIGPAAVVVAPPSDAVKVVSEDGTVVESLDRDDLWAVEAFVLDRALAQAWDRDVTSPLELFQLVRRAGHSWQWVSRDPSDL